jgi:hypothetical protein
MGGNRCLTDAFDCLKDRFTFLGADDIAQQPAEITHIFTRGRVCGERVIHAGIFLMRLSWPPHYGQSTAI